MLLIKVLLDLDTYDSSNKAYISFGQSLRQGGLKAAEIRNRKNEAGAINIEHYQYISFENTEVSDIRRPSEEFSITNSSNVTKR